MSPSPTRGDGESNPCLPSPLVGEGLGVGGYEVKKNFNNCSLLIETLKSVSLIISMTGNPVKMGLPQLVASTATKYLSEFVIKKLLHIL